VYSRNKTRIDRAVFCPYGHRGVSAPSFRDSAIHPHGHRGVSASSSRDGAIPLSFVTKIEKIGFAQRAQRTQRKNWQGTGFARKKKRHAGLKSGVHRPSQGGSRGRKKLLLRDEPFSYVAPFHIVSKRSIFQRVLASPKQILKKPNTPTNNTSLIAVSTRVPILARG